MMAHQYILISSLVQIGREAPSQQSYTLVNPKMLSECGDMIRKPIGQSFWSPSVATTSGKKLLSYSNENEASTKNNTSARNETTRQNLKGPVVCRQHFAWDV
jgi:erythromycin esterase-like protein